MDFNRKLHGMLRGVNGTSIYSTRMGMSRRLRDCCDQRHEHSEPQKATPRGRHKKKPSASVPKAWGDSFRGNHFFISSFFVLSFISPFPIFQTQREFRSWRHPHGL